MSTTSPSERHIHQGRNLKRYREMMGIKQQSIATDLGEGWNQKKVSRLEEQPVIDKKILEQVSKILNISMETIENKDADGALVSIQNNYEGSNNSGTNTGGVNNAEGGAVNVYNPFDKITELYERLLASEKEKVELFKETLSKLK